MSRHLHSVSFAALLALLLTAACSVSTTRYTNPDFNFGFVQRIAILPMENYSDDSQAGVRATRLLITELLATGAVEVVELGETLAALNRISGASNTPSKEQFVALGKALGAQAVLAGSVAQSQDMRSGTIAIPVVTLDLHMVETESGATVWAATHSERGASAGARLLGTGGEPRTETTRRCVRALVDQLVR